MKTALIEHRLTQLCNINRARQLIFYQNIDSDKVLIHNVNRAIIVPQCWQYYNQNTPLDPGNHIINMSLCDKVIVEGTVIRKKIKNEQAQIKVLYIDHVDAVVQQFAREAEHVQNSFKRYKLHELQDNVEDTQTIGNIAAALGGLSLVVTIITTCIKCCSKCCTKCGKYLNRFPETANQTTQLQLRSLPECQQCQAIDRCRRCSSQRQRQLRTRLQSDNTNRGLLSA